MDVMRLAEQIAELMALLQRPRNRKALSTEAGRERMERLAAALQAAGNQLKTIISRHRLIRFLQYSNITQAIIDYTQKINWSIQCFTVETLLAVEFALDEQFQGMDVRASRIEEKIESGFQQMSARLDVGEGRLPYAIYAQFDYKVREHCLEGTRMDVLDQIHRWIDAEGQAQVKSDALDTPSIFWINGSAGTGKTTIASTVAETCRARGILGATFFCSRDDAECSNPNIIFTTIAQQLGRFWPPFKVHLDLVLKLKPDIGYSSVPYQLQELIVKPLAVVRKSFPKCVVVVDALNECKDSKTTSVVLSSLSRHVTELEPLKILITSRPEPQVTSVFRSSPLNLATQRLVLHEIELGVVQHDIERYLTVNLQRIGQIYHMEDSWPSRPDIVALAHLSSGLFIFAATAVRYIEDRNYSDPSHQLSVLLREKSMVPDCPSSPHYHLDRLYTDVLLQAFPSISLYLAGKLKMVLGTIVLLRDHLSPRSLERLLKLTPNTVRTTLAHLHSVVIVPEDDSEVIRMLHPSFFDFMTNPLAAQCANAEFVIHAPTQHTLLARACLNTLCRQLKRDICEIWDPSALNADIEDLPMRIQKCIPLHLQYACRHWAYHLTNGMMSEALFELIEEFCSRHILHWVEVCCLLGELRNALLSLDVAQQIFGKSPRASTNVRALLRDCERFAREFFPVLSIAPLQIYYSASLFTPRQTLLRSTYRHRLPLPMTALNAMGDTWSSCIRTIDGHHSGGIECVAVSPDGTRVVSGSLDRTVRLWDVVSGTHLNVLAGHQGTISSVLFSPDGAQVVSGSHDHTIRLWDTYSGSHLRTFTGHANPVLAVACSADGKSLASGSYDETVHLWDVCSGTLRSILKGHSKATSAVQFSPDCGRVVSGSRDGSLRLWDVLSGDCLHILVGHSENILSVAFSPDGKRILSSSYDRTIRLWDAHNGRRLKPLKGHSEPVTSATFSSDGKWIVSGSHDKTIRLWNATDGTCIGTLAGHSDWIQSVAFSPGGTRVVSGSNDGTLRLWDVGVVDSYKFQGHSGWVSCLALSQDSARLVSGSHDRTLRIWDVNSGVCLQTLVGHSDAVTSVAFSPNGTYIASAAYDLTIRLWAASSGTHIRTLPGQRDGIHTLVFSPDSTRIIAESPGKIVVTWDTITGTLSNTTTSLSAALVASQMSADSIPEKIAASNTTSSPDAYVMKEAWIVCATTKRRVCWLPFAFRPYRIASKGNNVALGTRDGKVIILDLTGFDKNESEFMHQDHQPVSGGYSSSSPHD